MNTYLTNIKEIIENNLGLKIFDFSWINEYGLIIAISYIVLIVILGIRKHYSQKTFLNMNTIFRVSVDNLFYTTSKILALKKDQIYDFKGNIPLLLKTKTSMIALKDKAFYYENFEKLREEIEYIYKLTETPIDENMKQKTFKEYNIIKTLQSTQKTIDTTLQIFTLGLNKIFL